MEYTSTVRGYYHLGITNYCTFAQVSVVPCSEQHVPGRKKPWLSTDVLWRDRSFSAMVSPWRN